MRYQFTSVLVLLTISVVCSLPSSENDFLSDIEIKEFKKAKDSMPKCVNPTGEEVDYYIIYLMNDAYKKFMYIDNKLRTFQTYDTTVAQFPPLRIASSLNNPKGVHNFIAWNSESIVAGHEQFSTQAHSKGIISYNEEGGIYLLHSLPKFPYFENEKFIDDFPPNAGIYVQTFLCLSLNIKNIDKLLSNLGSIRPGIQKHYSLNFDALATTTLLKSLIDQERVEKRVFNESITTKNNAKFNLFGKPNNVSELPWDKPIPEFYNESFYVATWTRPNQLPSVCDEYEQVFNIQSFNVNTMTYKNTNDHSKWGVSASVWCIGDLNRTESQLTRSGVVMCFKNSKIVQLTYEFIDEYEPCYNEDAKEMKFLE